MSRLIFDGHYPVSGSKLHRPNWANSSVQIEFTDPHHHPSSNLFCNQQLVLTEISTPRYAEEKSMYTTSHLYLCNPMCDSPSNEVHDPVRPCTIPLPRLPSFLPPSAGCPVVEWDGALTNWTMGSDPGTGTDTITTHKNFAPWAGTEKCPSPLDSVPESASEAMAKPGPDRACHRPSRSNGKLRDYNYKQPRRPPFDIQEAWRAAWGVLPTPHLNRFSA